jgi:hypothetical protein
VVFSRNFDVARNAMASLRPEIASKMVEPVIYNRATYSCAAVTMARYDWPGVEGLPSSATQQ